MFLCYKSLYRDVHVATSPCTEMYMLLQVLVQRCTCCYKSMYRDVHVATTHVVVSVLLVFAVVFIVIT